VSLAVGLTRDSSESDLIKMTDSNNNYRRFLGSYSDLSNRVDEVVQLLCAVRQKGKLRALICMYRTLRVIGTVSLNALISSISRNHHLHAYDTQ